jgi:ABC-type uncharacterized transport system permease subunit
MVLHSLAAALYAALALHVWRTRWRGEASAAAPGRMRLLAERGILLAALIVHALGLRLTVFNAEAIHFGFAIALSLMFWLAMALYLVESLYARLDGLQAIGLPAAAVAALLPALFSEPHVLTNAGSPAFRLHLFAAMLAYSLFTLAALHALLMAAAERRLHRGRLSPLFADLPPLLTMEAMLFRLIHVAFLLLTVTLVSGIFFSEDLFGRALRFDHKTVFAILSWLIFAALLLGRHLRGWRGRLALRWTLTGFLTLLLAYVGSRFVLEVILGRGY